MILVSVVARVDIMSCSFDKHFVVYFLSTLNSEEK
jgi:hypothetical protein